MKIPFFFTIPVLSLIFFSTISLVSANQEMQGNGSYMQIEPLQPGSRTEETLLQQKRRPEDSVRITFTPSAEGTRGFTFSLSPLFIDYGEITPTNPLIRNASIVLKNSASPVYSIFVGEDHSLLDPHGSFIPNTSCDSGTCTEYRASVWENTLSFGFGYRCDNHSGFDCHQEFAPANAFRQFPDNTKNGELTDIMRGMQSSRTKKTTVTFKVNTAASQPQGSYSNTVTFFAVPGY